MLLGFVPADGWRLGGRRRERRVDVERQVLQGRLAGVGPRLLGRLLAQRAALEGLLDVLVVALESKAVAPKEAELLPLARLQSSCGTAVPWGEQEA